MDTDVQALEAPSSSPPPPRAVRSRPSSWSSSASSGSMEYTSLRDVLSELGPGGSGGSGADVHDFDTTHINIRNQLLKHAASAYLQSAIVVTPRNRGCLSRVWRRMLQLRRCRIVLRPCAWPWHGCECDVDNPVHRCAASLAGSARCLLACLWLRRLHVDVARVQYQYTGCHCRPHCRWPCMLELCLKKFTL